MKEIKTSGEYKIYEKRSGRYAVKDKSKQYVNGDDKAKILADVGLITIPEAKPEPVEADAGAEEVPAEEASADDTSAEEPAEETPAEEASTEEAK